MHYLTPSLCRASRALLDWSQPDLARKCNIHVQTISAFENETGTPTRNTLEKIAHCFEKEGIEFSNQGLVKNDFPAIKVEGKSGEETYLKILQDVYTHLQDKDNKELLLMYADDHVSPPSVNEMYRKMRKSGITMRQLIEEGNTYIIGPLEEYRYIPKKAFINRVTLIYGDRIANETGDVSKAVIRVDAVNATIQRNLFNLLWNYLEKPLETSATEKF